MNTQPISNSQTVMNSVINSNTVQTACDLTAEPKQAPLHKSNTNSRDSLISDCDLFGDDEELLQNLENDESTWAAVSGTQATQDGNRWKEFTLQALPDDINDALTHSNVINDSQTSSVVDDMLISDDLPNSPEFSVNDLPIFSKQKTIDNKFSIVDNQPTVTGNLSNIADSDMEVHTQSQHDMPDIDFNSTMDEPAANGSEATNHRFTQKMDMLDILDIPDRLSPTIESVQVQPTADQDDIAQSNLGLFQAVDNENDLGSRFKQLLRQRNAIQLHPFTIEQARFQSIINRSTMKGKITTVSTQIADSQDTEFTPSNTQLIDVSTDETQTSQSSKKANSKVKTMKKRSLPSKISKRTQHRSTTLHTEEIRFDDISSPVFDKYGLDQLILPPVNIETKKANKPKMITFQKKKTSRKEKSVARRFPLSSSSSSSSTSRTKDIFDFDAQPRSAFNFTNDQHNMNSNQNDYAQKQLQEMNNDPDFDENNGSMDDEETEDMDIDNQDMIKRRFRMKKYSVFDSSDEDNNDDPDIDAFLDEEEPPVENELTEAELDAIFNFPGTSSTPKPSGRRLMRPWREDDLVPIVDDELEYREHKRQKVGIRDVLKKEKTLRSILPASFIKVYQKELLEEDQRRKAPKKRTVHPTKFTAAAKTNSNQSSSTNEAHPDVFAAFLGSQSDDDSGADSDEVQDAYPTLDDYVTRLDYSTQISTDHPMFEGSTTSTRDLLGFFGNKTPYSDNRPLKQTRLKLGTNTHSASMRRPHSNSDTISLLSRQQPFSVNRSVYPVEESIENNRIQSYYQGPNLKKSTREAKKSAKRAPRSSIAIKQPNGSLKKSLSIPIRDNPAPKKRRKKVKRTRDDIYAHAPYTYRAWNDRSGQAPDNNGRRTFQTSTDTPRMAFDDIYVGTRQYVRYANESLNGDRFNDLFRNDQTEQVNEKLGVLLVHTLPSVIRRVRHLHDYDLRRIRGLKDTVYLHHGLLAPLLSATPNLKSAYKHLASQYTNLTIFDKHFLWRSIVPENKGLIGHLFHKVSGDMYRICNHDAPSEAIELPGHDCFYVFVSICLTQWIPLHPYDDRIQLTEIFMRYIRYLGRSVPLMVAEHKTGNLSWRPIVKLMVYILDWTCRLHHLGVHQIDWSVIQCTKSLIDILVLIGFDGIQSCSKDYLSEAWICLLQITSVSSETSGFYFNEQVFLDQITDSIKTKSRSSDVYEFEKRRTMRLWAESLNFIIEKYMLL